MSDQTPQLSAWQRFYLRAAGRLGALILRIIVATMRIKVTNPPGFEGQIYGPGRKGLIVTWHRCWVMGTVYLTRAVPGKVAMMTSRSKDGEILAAFMRALGGEVVRGSSSRGGMAAQKELVRLMRDGRALFAANVADGPQGPRYEAKAGMISVAQLTGAPLIPVCYSIKPAWVLAKAWDRTQIPKPFSRAYISYGEPRQVPRKLTPDEREQWRRWLEDELNQRRQEVDRLTGHADPE